MVHAKLSQNGWTVSYHKSSWVKDHDLMCLPKRGYFSKSFYYCERETEGTKEYHYCDTQKEVKQITCTI